jgi:hypothetical protein
MNPVREPVSDQRMLCIRAFEAEAPALYATRGGSFLCVTSAGLFRSPDRGLTWQRADAGTLIAGARGLAAWSDGRLVLATGSGLLVSDDDGRSWRDLRLFEPLGVAEVTGIVARGPYLLVRTAGGVFVGRSDAPGEVQCVGAVRRLDPARLAPEGDLGLVGTLREEDEIDRLDLATLRWRCEARLPDAARGVVRAGERVYAHTGDALFRVWKDVRDISLPAPVDGWQSAQSGRRALFWCPTAAWLWNGEGSSWQVVPGWPGQVWPNSMSHNE